MTRKGFPVKVLAGLAVVVLAAAAAAVVALVVLGGGEDEEVSAPTATPSVSGEEVSFELAPTMADSLGVDPKTEFVLTADQEVDADLVQSLLRVEPSVALDVKAMSGHEFHIVPSEPLEQDQVYRFSLVEEHSAPIMLASWAFQTKSAIRIVETLPRNQATEVPVNSGIELTFSHDGIGDISDYFQITPATEGRFEVHKRVVVFVPGELKPATLYTVTVRGGLGLPGTDDVMAEDFVFQFETSDIERTGQVARAAVLDFTRKVAEASTSETPALSVYTSHAGELSVPISVFAYADIDAFLAALEEFQDIPTWARVTRDSYLADTAGLTSVAQFDAPVEQQGTYGDMFVRFPEPLPEGFYLVETELEGRRAQSWLQVTDIATYVTVTRTETLAWINDLATKGPLAGASLEFLGTGVETSTDDEGIARFDTPPEIVRARPPSSDYYEAAYEYLETSGNLLVTAPDGRKALAPLSNVSGYGSRGYYSYGGYFPSGSLYWHHISTDRPLYLPTDTVRFWGLARHREEAAPSEELTVELSGYDYFGFFHQPVTIAETDVKTSSLGTFSGELSFSGVSPGQYGLRVKAGEQVIDTAYVDIETYTKPAYKIDVAPSRRAVFARETVDFEINTSFFEGSPVPELRLGWRAYMWETGEDLGSGEVSTDSTGSASVSVEAPYVAYSYTYPNTLSLYVSPILAEEGEISGESTVSVFPSALNISASTELEDGQGIIEGSVYHIDLSRINEDTAEDYDDYLGAPAGGVTVSGQITEVSWERREAGEYYDFIAKIVRKRYEYDSKERSLTSFTATTDSDGDFRYTFPVEEEKYYKIELSVTDDAGRRATTEVTISGERSRFNISSGMVYLAPPGGQGDYWWGGTSEYAIGDEVVLEMRRGADLLPSGDDNRYLFYQSQNGLREYDVQEASSLRFPFAEANVPSTTVTGVWFNGITYQDVEYDYTLRFDPAERELEIEVSPDRELYEPGDTATLEISVTDRTGQPQEGAEVNLSAVDEAIFQLERPYMYEQEVLEALYDPVSSGILRTYASHQYPVDVSAAERGGDGGPRRDFVDVTFFGSVVTDSDGRASVSFDLPDNLTSWRITAQGVTADLKAGTSLKLLPVGLPFFVDVAMNSEYLVSDRPAIKLRSFGRELSSGQEVTFEVTAPSLGLTEPLTAAAPAFQAARVPLPELEEGEHEIHISGSVGDMRDSLVREVRVVQSRLMRGEARYYELEPGLQIEGRPDGPTRLIFSDHNRGRYYATLWQLTWGYGDRVDQMLARNLAADLLERYFEETEAAQEEFDGSLYQTSEGGIALFPYADDDLALSARVAALAPERFGRNGLASYFLGITENLKETRERSIIALYGLAGLGEPVLVRLQFLLDQEDLTWRERLYLGLAALEMGDEPTARSVYQGLLDDYGEELPPFLRLKVGADQDDILEATSLAAILAAGLGEEPAPALFDYTTNNYTKDILIELEQISYLDSVLPRLSPEEVRFAYTLDGEREEVTLERGRTFALQLTPEQLADLQLEALEGQVGVASSFAAPFDPAEIATDSEISVSRRYEGGGPEGVSITEEALVRITLDYELGPQALDGCYQVTDMLPSGLKAVTRPATRLSTQDESPLLRSDVWYPYRIEGQRVGFCAWKDRDSPHKTIIYYARVVSAGEYIAEPATIQSMKSAESFNLSAPYTVEIR
jgi:hypothetical protein